MKRLVIIGAGASGLFAASQLKNIDLEVIIVEKNNKTGKKLAITGKGRCNLTNHEDISNFFDKINTNKDFLYSSFYTFTNIDTENFFTSKGLDLVVERGNRVFPKSQKASDVVDLLNREIICKNIKILLNKNVQSIKKENNKFLIKFLDDYIEADYIIIATGGMSYPTTGSTGDGFRFAKFFGHKIVDPKPALVPIEITNDFIKDLIGISLKNVNLTYYKNNKKVISEFGEMLFTHFGISGPIVLKICNYVNKGYFLLDLKPYFTEEELDKKILSIFEKEKNKDLINGIKSLTTLRIIPTLIYLSKIDPNKKIHQITKEERKRLVYFLKNLRLDVKGLRDIKEGIITKGGVCTDEIDPSTMESKLINNLFFIGEVIDVDANTGGYNLQIAFSTAYLASLCIKERLNEN